MRKFLIATHGQLASGLKSALDLIIGEQEGVFTLNAYANGNESIGKALDELLLNVQEGEELLVFTDIMAGSITNQVIQRTAHLPHVHTVSGVNLALLIELVLSDQAEPIVDTIERAVEQAKKQVVYVDKMINKEEDND
ncbi:hypothetical protein LAG90_14460 [Marinilongibacter aquaticus]|uniref:PTS sugar transporter subunit IIA n=1 Tax=Marinilongibacter aquaticus TaxID=2975157 RepID=UPI0021BD1C5C|nr:hypothetical protein [Marinilongibacter aquaticus]UBM58007.1 hypothetical protein LAG90_14460 [Marinilongibacter aquaticus]